MRKTLAIAAFVATAFGAQAATLTLGGTIRDFKGSNEVGGHPDFEYAIADQTGAVNTTLDVDGKPTLTAGAINTGTFHTQADFAQWFRDTPGVNMSMPYSITLDDTGHPGLYTYTNNSFFPIDGLLFGNGPNSHNYHFTYELHTTFGFTGGETFTFSGDDDVWVFLNGQLAIDLGGVHGTRTGSVTLNPGDFGMTPGNNYTLDFFFAERHTSESNFSMATTLPLTTATPEPSSYALIGGGLTLVGLLRRKAFKK